MRVVKLFTGGRLLEHTSEEGKNYYILEEARLDNLDNRYYVEVGDSLDSSTRTERVAFKLINELIKEIKA